MPELIKKFYLDPQIRIQIKNELEYTWRILTHGEGSRAPVKYIKQEWLQ